jgi:signal transduction histidine kinase/DNA-binding NarL/FixJ family response regulator
MVLVDDDNHHYGRNDFGMFNLLRSPVWIFDIDQKAMYWANRSALYIWNATSLEELLARDFASDMSDAAWSFLLDTKRKLLLNQVVSEQWTFYPLGLGATTLDINCSAVRIEDGRIAMLLEAEIIGNKREMTESTVRSIEILKHLPIAVSQFTQQGRLIYQNPQAYHLFGATSSSRSEQENTNNKASSSTAPAPAASSSDTVNESKSQLEQSPTETSETIVQRPDENENVLLRRFVDLELGQSALQQIQKGTDFSAEAQLYTHPPEPLLLSLSDATIVDQPRWFNVLLRRARDPVTSEFVILYIARDIEDIVRARKETTKAALKSEFLDVMAHEIRTPLHQIVGHVDLLEDSVLNKEQLESVQQIQSSSSLLMSIINDLLDCSKLEYGQVQIEHVTFALDTVVNGCIASSRPQAQKKNITLTCHIDSSCAPYLIADPNRLRQILNNLLSNAVKFTETGSVSLTVEPCDADASWHESSSLLEHGTSAATRRQRLRFSVTDTGIGIDAKEQTVIFERYRQANSSVARQFGGTGLGLPICKGLVELMHGIIGLHSEMGRGTTFFFEIPFAVAHATIKNVTKRTTSPDKVAPQKPPLSASPSMEVLVVEDNKVNQKVVKSMLQRFGHVVTIAENGQVALKELNQKRFHLILMDIQMPVMDGIECTKYIRNVLHLSKEQMPIVGLTAGFQLSEQSFYENEVGMNSCLGKPLPMDALKNTLACYQQSHPALKETKVVNTTTAAIIETSPTPPKHVLDAAAHTSISLIPPIDYSSFQLKNLDLAASPKKKHCS